MTKIFVVFVSEKRRAHTLSSFFELQQYKQRQRFWSGKLPLSSERYVLKKNKKNTSVNHDLPR